MEFAKPEELDPLLKEYRIERQAPEGNLVYLRMRGDEDVHVHLACAECAAEPLEGAETHVIDREKVPDYVEALIHRLHLDQVLLVPVAEWRHVFDAVAFSLASNEDWQEFDASATVELNTRDPLIGGPADFQVITALLRALVTDAEETSAGLMMLSPAAPLLAEYVPGGALRITYGSKALADEMADLYEHV